MIKKCSVCGNDKKLEDYSKDKYKKSGYKSQCKECVAKVPYNREQTRWRKIKAKYNLTESEYNKMLLNQNGKCSICGQPETEYHANGELRYLSIDHCHKTNKIRSLLCSKCNTTLGQVNEDVEVLSKMIDYLKIHSDVVELADIPDSHSGGELGKLIGGD